MSHPNAPDDSVPPLVNPRYDKIYHYGCINQNWTTNSLGTPVSNWGLHEQWNILMTSAMMHHIITTLKPGGSTILKVRVFRRCETLGLVSLLSSVFDRMELADVPDMLCSYVGFIGFGMTHDMALRQQVADLMWRAMDQDPSHIFCNPVMQSEKVKNNMAICNQHRQSMMDSRARANTLFLCCVRHFCNQLQFNHDPYHFPDSELIAYYGKERAAYFKNRWIDLHFKLEYKEKLEIVLLMDKAWMREVC
jgi:hypothetical protein